MSEFPVISKSSIAVVEKPLASRIADGQIVKGLRLVTLPMEVKDVVTIFGSFYGGDVFNPPGNEMVAEITANMLDKGTEKRDKFVIGELLESVGARINFDSDDYRASFSVRCLKENLPLVVELLAEQLRSPAFQEADLLTTRKRYTANLMRQNENTDYRARARFTQLNYPGNHPNCIPTIESQVAGVESIEVSHPREFHQRLYGLGNMTVVATGDIDRAALEEIFGSQFINWPQVNIAPPSLDGRRGFLKLPLTEETVTMPEKTSVDLTMGFVIGINREHSDYLPLSLASYILGGNFSARLMSTVRDEQGLTYGIGSGISGAMNRKDGYWITHGTFAPELVAKGRAATLAQIEKWIKKGVTEDELEVKKNTLNGSYKVGLATTSGMAAAILDILERGKEISCIDDYPNEINAVTLDQANATIRNYIHLDRLVTVCAGSIDEQWKPL
jgi:zinc protease